MIRENARVVALQTRLQQVRTELQEAQAEAARGEVRDYEFMTLNGAVRLSSLFGRKRDLFVMHNMGKGCANCTMWSDGFNGLYPHISDRAAFVVCSPDAPEVQAELAKARGWRFPMVSDPDKAFFRDMGFLSKAGAAQPGISAFQKEGASIMRVSASGMEPYDDFCPVWHMFNLLPEGADGWKARPNYD